MNIKKFSKETTRRKRHLRANQRHNLRSAITVTSIVSRLCVQFTSADVVITPGVSSSSCHGPLTPYFYWTGLLFIQLILSTTSMVALDRKEISLFTLTSYLWLLNYIF